MPSWLPSGSGLLARPVLVWQTHPILYELDKAEPIDWEALFAVRRNCEARGVRSVQDSITELFSDLAEHFTTTRTAIVFSVKTKPGNDVLGGWRVVWYFAPGSPKTSRAVQLAMKALRWKQRDAAALGEFGRRRAFSSSYLNSPNHTQRRLAKLLNVGHRIHAVQPIGPSAEVYLLLDRTAAKEPFVERDVSRALAALHVLEPVVRMWGRMLGILNGRLLSPRECEVLVLLLRGQSEQESANELKVARSTVHQLVVGLYRKFEVNSRAELLAQFVDSARTPDPPWTSRVMKIGAIDPASDKPFRP